MTRILSILLATFWSCSASAVPVTFVDSIFTADVVVGLGIESGDDTNTVAIPPDSDFNLPAFASAELPAGFPVTGDFAIADAFADRVQNEYFLDANTEINVEPGSGVDADAIAIAGFSGSFSGAGDYRLSIEFESFADVVGSNGADSITEVLVSIVGGFDTILDTTLDTEGSVAFDFMLLDDGLASLDVLLLSDAFIFGEGFVAATSSVAFTLDREAMLVPEPSAIALSAIVFLVAAFGTPGARRNIAARS